MTHYIIVANGNFLIKEILLEATKRKTIIALDGAADKLKRIGLMPHIILGDFDGHTQDNQWGIQQTFHELDDTATPYLGHHDVTIVPRKNQELTDLVKAIHYCDEQQASSITLICAVGGRLDHHETALRSLRTAYRKTRPLLLHTEQQTLRYAKNETVVINGEVGDKCGILAFPQGSMTTQGLAYDVTDYALHFGYSESVANTLIATAATVSVTGEALLIMPPQLKSQREFMKKSEREKLELQLRDVM